ncbi:MAG: TraR/DksA C4-type zinc finger protein [Actinomycetota bacterium]|nr:TraR/DksA C4-type zinc finger protein [Actinomycetota bacterium]
MTEVDRQTIETALDERLEELRRTRAGMQRESEGGLAGEVSHVDNHPGDEGTETHERELEVTTELFLEEEERRIGEARRALAEGRYGKCMNCGTEIPGARLTAMPEAVRCLDCQRHFEGLHNQHHSLDPDR